MDYALDLNPFENEAENLPAVVIGESTMELSYTEKQSNLSYQVEVSPDLSLGSWTTDNIITTGGATKTAVYHQSGSRMFMRLKVKAR